MSLAKITSVCTSGLRGRRREPRTPSPVELPLAELTLTNASRFVYFKRLFDQAPDGDVVECGVGKGTSLLMWASLCHDEGQRRRVWGFDSFEGFPDPSPNDSSPRDPQRGEWSGSTPKSIVGLLFAAGFSGEWVRSHITLVPGFFKESLDKYVGGSIALLHLDVDLYESYQTCLDVLYHKVVPGGLIAFDEYMGTFEHLSFPGARKAIDEFFGERSVDILRDPSFGKYYYVKAA